MVLSDIDKRMKQIEARNKAGEIFHRSSFYINEVMKEDEEK